MSGDLPRIALADRRRARPLTQAEAGFVLGLARRDIRNMLRRGELRARWSGRRRLVDTDDVVARIYRDPLALYVLTALVDGRMRAPRIADPYATPPSHAEAVPAP